MEASHPSGQGNRARESRDRPAGTGAGVTNTTPNATNRRVEGLGMFEDSTWRSSAECRGENAVYFFAPSHFERKPEKDLREGMARALSRRCKVQQQCLDYSIQI